MTTGLECNSQRPGEFPDVVIRRPRHPQMSEMPDKMSDMPQCILTDINKNKNSANAFASEDRLAPLFIVTVR